ncbi:MAG: hypothetical protein VB050_10310 [Geobacteraceae bacterium]|nr:hypothetical protein [Geobacteraceae bacterium]
MSFGYGPALDKQQGISLIRSPVDLHGIDTTASKITVQGTRHPEKLEKVTGL